MHSLFSLIGFLDKFKDIDKGEVCERADPEFEKKGKKLGGEIMEILDGKETALVHSALNGVFAFVVAKGIHPQHHGHAVEMFKRTIEETYQAIQKDKVAKG